MYKIIFRTLNKHEQNPGGTGRAGLFSRRYWPVLLVLATFLFAPGRIQPQSSDCGRVVFGGLDWDSSRFHVAVAGYILKHGMGCEVDVIPGTTTPLLAALGRGDVDVLMEVWAQNYRDAWNKLKKSGEVLEAGVNFPDATQGFFVPTYLVKGDPERGIEAKAPGLKTIFDVKKYKHLFRDPEMPEKGRFLNCILGWSCEDVNTKKFYAYNLDEDFTNFRPGTGAALAAQIASHYEKGEPFFTYYWGPTWLLGKYDLTMIQEPDYDPDIWENLVSVKDPKDATRATAYPVVKVVIGLNRKFAKKNPRLKEFFQSYETTADMTNKALAYIREKKGRTIQDSAQNFLRERPDVWREWVEEDVREKVEERLATRDKSGAVFKLNIGGWINDGVNFIVQNYGVYFEEAAKPVLFLIKGTERLINYFPWWLFSLALGGLGFLGGGWRLGILVTGCLALVQLLGLWGLAMQTLALMIIATVVCTLFGLPVGILSARYDRFRSALMPVLDAMQTMPSFVYLIPALMLFGLGKVPAVFATVIYAIAPTIRLTDLGLRRVDAGTVEAARAFGASYRQLLFKVQMPLALPTIMAGINQTTMLALSMVVIASMIGARGLGEQVLLGIQKLDVGRGFTAGIAIVLLAIVLDRITQSVGKKLDRARAAGS